MKIIRKCQPIAYINKKPGTHINCFKLSLWIRITVDGTFKIIVSQGVQEALFCQKRKHSSNLMITNEVVH